MDPAKVKAALDALISGDAEACASILKDLIASAAGGEETPAGESADTTGETLDAPVADPNAPKPEEKGAALTALRALTGKVSLGEIVVALTAWKADRDAVATAQATLDEGARIELVGELVKLRAETPGTAWADPVKKIPAAHLSAEPLSNMRTRVAALRGIAGVPPKVTPPVVTVLTVQNGGKTVTLSDGQKVNISAAEIAACKKKNLSHEDFAARKSVAVKRV